MSTSLRLSLRARLTLWYVAVLAVLLLIYAALVFAFQYGALRRQIFHDEVQDVVTTEGLLYFDGHGALQLQQNYYSRPQSHLLVDRLMEVLDLSGNVLYRSPTLHGMPLGGPLGRDEGDASFDPRIVTLADGSHAFIISHIHALLGHTMVIRLGYNMAPLRQRMLQFLLLLLVAFPLALLIAGAAGQTIAERGLQPLERMTARAESITESNLHDRLEVENPADELGQMAAVFNHLLQRLEGAFQQMKRFTADAAHELRTPLASIRTVSEVALDGGNGLEEYRQALGSILEETARLNDTINSLILLARAEAAQPGREQTIFPAKSLIEQVLTVLGVLIEEKQITVLQEDEEIGAEKILADYALLRIAFMNVLHNALKFSPPGSLLRISYCRTEAIAQKLVIAIQDQGPGVALEDRQRVFERFYTSSNAHTVPKSGSGLGLSIAKLVIDRMGGTIRFEEAKQGAKCVIELPLLS